MIKRYISYFLAVVFIICEAGNVGAKGFWFWDTSNGFQIVGSKEYPEYEAVLTLYEHKKTGALAVHWRNHDVNKAFEISFRTPTLDDSGVNHVLEHCVCSGSKKYPDKDLIFKVINQTSNTFMNAFTEVGSTSYVAASLSGKQLLGFMDMFMDSIFHPLVENDRMIFERECYRLQQKDIDSELTETGTVYNEMEQIFSDINFVSWMNSLKSLYASSNYSCVPGGDPKDIKELTYEHLLDTWKNYYQPSNMFISLYGDLNADEILKYIDNNYLYNRSKTKVDVSEKNINCQAKAGRREYDFPIENSNDTAEDSIEIIAYSIDDREEISNSQINALALSFCNEGCYFKKEVMNQLPNVRADVYFGSYGEKNIFEFVASGICHSELEKFESIVSNSISAAAKNGFSEDIIKNFDKDTISHMCADRTEKRSMRFGRGIYIIKTLCSKWLWGQDILSDFKSEEEVIDNDTLKFTAAQSILHNNNKAITVTSPKKGLFEQNKLSRQQELKNIKSKMSKEELQGLVNKTKRFEEWSNQEPPKDVIKGLQLMKVNDLRIEVPQNRAVRQFINGVDLIGVPTDDEVLYSGNIIFDISKLSKEEYYVSKLLTSFIGEVNTALHDKYDIRNIISRQVFMPLIMHTSFKKDGENHMGILCSWTGKTDNYLSDFDLIKECIFDMDLCDYDNMKNCILKLENNFKKYLAGNSHNEMLKRGKYFCDRSRGDVEKQFDLQFYEFLKRAEKEIESNPEMFTYKLKEISKVVFSKKNIIIGVEGNTAFISDTKGKWLGFANKFYNQFEINEFESNENSEPTEVKSREAFNVGGNVQFNGMVCSCAGIDLMNSGSREVFANVLDDKYLIPNVRHRIGAYFCNMFFDGGYMVLMSGGDPGLSETFDVFDRVPEFIRGLKITQHELDQYIIKAYYNIIYYNINYYPVSMMFDSLAGVTQEQKEDFLFEIKNTNISDMNIFADILEKMIKNGYRFTVGSGSIIEENKEKFDKVLNIDG